MKIIGMVGGGEDKKVISYVADEDIGLKTSFILSD